MTFLSMPWDPKVAAPAVPMNEGEWRLYNGGRVDGFTDVGSMVFSNTTGTVTLSGARGQVQGAQFVQQGSDQVTRPSVPAGRERWDWIALRYDPSENRISLALLEGTPAVSNPLPPLLAQHMPGNNPRTGIYEFPCGYIAGANGTAFALPHGDLRTRQTRTAYARSDEEMLALGLNARDGDLAVRSDGIYRWNSAGNGSWAPVWARREFDGCGSQPNVAFDSSGGAIINHNLGWTPVFMDFIHDGDHATQSVNFSIRWIDSMRVGIHGRSLAGNVPYTSTLTRVRWTAER